MKNEDKIVKIEKYTKISKLSKGKRRAILISLISAVVGGIFWFLYTITPENNYANNRTFAELLNGMLKFFEMLIAIGSICAIESSLLCYIILNIREMQAEKEEQKQKNIEM